MLNLSISVYPFTKIITEDMINTYNSGFWWTTSIVKCWSQKFSIAVDKASIQNNFMRLSIRRNSWGPEVLRKEGGGTPAFHLESSEAISKLENPNSVRSKQTRI